MAESPIPNEFQRPAGWRFQFEGVNLREVPDAIKPTKFASALNIRATQAQGVQTRPGYTQLFTAGVNPITDLAAYATLGTDDAPRFLGRDSNNGIYQDTGSLLVTLGGSLGSGVWMLPFRPSESPQTWMYVASLQDYQKLSAPDSTDAVTVYKVGIAESQNTVEAVPSAPVFQAIAALFGGTMVAGGEGGAAIKTYGPLDTVGTVKADPLDPARFSCQVSPTIPYQVGWFLDISGAGSTYVQAVLPAVTPNKIAAIRYHSGATGLATITCAQAPFGANESDSVDLGNIPRGSLIKIGGTETVFVLSSTSGPDGSVCFDCVTAGSFAVGAALLGVSAIILQEASGTIAPGAVLSAGLVNTTVFTPTSGGVTTLTAAIVAPFTTLTAAGIRLEDSYIHITVQINAARINELRLIFNLDPNDFSFQTNALYYSIQPSLLAGVANYTETQLEAVLSGLSQTTLPDGTDVPAQTPPGANVTVSMNIPISSFIRIGDNQTLTMANANGVQVLINTNGTGATGIAVQDIYVFNAGQPDVGETGAAYRYRVVPRNSQTGVRGNPSPVMRYGVSPRLQPVVLTLPSAAYDPQIDTWDIERYGGSVTSYRYIGSVPASTSTFKDNYFDTAALGGSEMQVDNFEPWPSIDVPFRVDVGGTVTVSVAGTFITISGVASWPGTILSWLPGMLIQIGGQSAYTLRNRPTALSGTSYLFEVEECIGTTVTPSYFWVLEPKVANNPNPYIFGPDVNGTFFGVGDALRPGTVSFSKSNVPDSVPDKYNLDLCPPSEPLLGGSIKGGVALVASTQRWWALYPSFGSITRYNPIEQSVGRGLISPYAFTTDGVLIYFWMKDGIGITAGGPYQSLTDEDLFLLFPHEGVAGVNITRFGLTYYAPDYGRVATFRLRKVKTYLFADYQDSTGAPHTLVCDLRTKGWSQDVYNDPIVCHFSQEQQSGPVQVPGSPYTGMVMGDNFGNVWVEQDCAGDDSTQIPCHIGTFEWDGGDQRMQPLFGDSYIDCQPNSDITVQPVSQGNSICPPTVIPAGNRTLSPVSVQGGQLQKYMGLLVSWSD